MVVPLMAAPVPHSRIHIHGLALERHFLDINIPADITLADDLFIQHSGSALGELVTLSLSGPLVRLDVATLEGRLVLGYDGYIAVGTGTQIVEDTRKNGLAAQLHRLVTGQVGLPLGLENGHGGEGSRAHGDIGELVGAAVGVNGEEMGAGGVDASDDEVGTDMALVPEQVLLEQSHAGDDTGLAAGR